MNYKKLSSEEKQLARDIVAHIKTGALPREFQILLSGEVINYNLPKLESKFSKGKLLALKNLGLLDFTDQGNYLEVFIHEPIFDAVSNNFSLSNRHGWLDTEINLPLLVNRVSDKLNQDELNTLCLDFALDNEELGNDTAPKSQRIERLFLLAEKQKRLGKLLRLIEKLIPGQDWLRLFED